LEQGKLQGQESIPQGNLNQKIIIVIGASTGGTDAIFRVLKDMPSNSPGILVVQHIPPVFSKMFAERLNNTTSLKFSEAQTGDLVETGKVLLAPGDKHLRLVLNNGNYQVDCFSGPKVNGHCPSVDVLFDSAAKCAGSQAIGVIMTGMGYDGAKGLLSLRQQGARTIGQDEKSSVVYGMPRVAFNIGAVEKQVPFNEISHTIINILGLT